MVEFVRKIEELTKNELRAIALNGYDSDEIESFDYKVVEHVEEFTFIKSSVISVEDLFYRITAISDSWGTWDFNECVQVRPESYTAVRFVKVKNE